MSTPRLWVSIAVALCAAFSSAAFVAVAQAGLPDGRAYELVTPQENYGAEVYQPMAPVEYSGAQTELHFQAAANGEPCRLRGGADYRWQRIARLQKGQRVSRHPLA